MVLLIALATYFVEWIPNNASSSPGEFPWQL
jgi:hypothetical protein